MDTHCIVMTTTDTAEEAKALAGRLIEERLAACVQVHPVTSHYSWEGSVEESSELLLLIKTTQDRYSDVEKFLLGNHSYETPEIIRTPITAGSEGYLAWMNGNTARA